MNIWKYKSDAKIQVCVHAHVYFFLCFYRLSVAMEGSCTGHLGIGFEKVSSLEEQHAGIGFNVMLNLKEGFDPKQVMNPGKVIKTSNRKTS